MICADADALMLEITNKRTILKLVELVETVKESVPDVVITGTQTTEGTGQNP